jgi:hypothetical protein
MISEIFGKRKQEYFFIAAAIFIGLLFFVVMTANHKVFTADAWYYLSFVFQKDVAVANIFALAFWLLTLAIFTFAVEKKENPLFIGSLFLLNIFSLKFLAPDPNTFLFWTFGFCSIIIVKNFKIFDHKYYAFALVLAYQIFHNIWIPGTSGFADTVFNPIGYIAFMPTAYLLFKNRNYKTLLLIIGLVTLFMSAKYVFEGLPILMFAFYLDFLGKDMKFDNFDYGVLGMFCTFSILLFVMTPFTEVALDNSLFTKYCDTTTKICQSQQLTDIGYSNYFVNMGYFVNNTENWGLCTCGGTNCLKGIIVCGNSIINISQIK